MNILIVKIGAMGDVLRTTFIAQALKERYKYSNPKIYWITDEKAKPIFANNPYVYKIIAAQEKDTLKNLFFDEIINLEDDKEICRFISSLKSSKITGFTYNKGSVLPTQTAKEWFNMSALGKKPENDLLKKKNKKTHRQIMAEIAGIKDYSKYEPFLRLTSKQRDFANEFMRRHNLSRAELIVGINTGAADRWPKHLSIKKTAQLIDRIYKAYRAKIILFGGPNEINRNQEILRISKSPVITAGCGNDLYEFPALISICSLIITSDSLGLHVALALKRKTIALIGPTSPNELDMYGLGEKVIADSKCICCYKPDCKSMEKISPDKIMNSIKKILFQKITLLITAFKEPNIGKSIEAALKQKTRYDYDIIVSAPDKDTLDIAQKYAKKHKNLKIFKDPGKGKSYALNLIFSSVKTDLLILTDGDVWISDNTVEEISNIFLDPEIGCATGRPVPFEKRNSKYGYWANFLFESAHKLRKTAFDNNSFLECSGYLFAFRKNIINKIPLDVAEDAVIPYYFWEKGYRIGYAENARVYVKNPENWTDWIKQKTRTSKAHETLEKYVDIKTTPRVKSFKTEAKGIFWLLAYPKNIKEWYWTKLLILARLYMWIKVFYDTKLKHRHYGDAWERVESAR
jgi:heptosyltransferase-2